MEELCLQHWRHSSTNKVVGFFQSFIPFSVPCSLLSNFKLSSLGALRTNKDEKWVFLCCLMWCLPSHPSMHSLLQCLAEGYWFEWCVNTPRVPEDTLGLGSHCPPFHPGVCMECGWHSCSVLEC